MSNSSVNTGTRWDEPVPEDDEYGSFEELFAGRIPENRPDPELFPASATDDGSDYTDLAKVYSLESIRRSGGDIVCCSYTVQAHALEGNFRVGASGVPYDHRMVQSTWGHIGVEPEMEFIPLDESEIRQVRIASPSDRAA